MTAPPVASIVTVIIIYDREPTLGSVQQSRRRHLWLAALMVFLLTGCAAGPGQSDALSAEQPDMGASTTGGDVSDGQPRVVVTTNILGDVVGNITGEAAQVDVLMPVGSDPHAFEISARQAESLRDADLVVMNGLGLEEGMSGALETAEQDGVRVLAVAEQVDPLPFGDAEAAHDGGEHGTHEPGSLDPHFWMDPLRMAEAVRSIGAELDDIATDAGFTAQAERYASEIEGLHDAVEALVEKVPERRRKLVTNHEALGYFAHRYGFEQIGTVVPSGTTLAEPSAADLERLVFDIRQAQVPAIFVETTASERLAEAVAAEVGSEIEVVELYTGSLGEDGSEAGSYLDMLRTDAERIAEALSR